MSLNNFEFWNNYNKTCIEKISLLIDKNKKVGKDYVLVDFHIHSNYSSDGAQTLDEIIENSNKNNIQIISITDHDDVKVYNEIKLRIKNNTLPLSPIIVTGIEHTVQYNEYGAMCHILKHFINPVSKNLLNDITTTNKAYIKRSKIQIERLKKNKVIKEVCFKNNILIDYKDFVKYLNRNKIKIPDYVHIINYLAEKLDMCNISYRALFEELKEYSKTDLCKTRRELIEKRYDFLENKYKNLDVEKNTRFLLSILAIRGVHDEDYKTYEIWGSLSIFEYGLVNIFNLNNEGITTFAHPTESVVYSLINCGKICGKLIGIENNFKNLYKNKELFDEVKRSMGLIEFKGSDIHSVSEKVYENIDFYKMKLVDLETIIKLGGKND